ncbi:endoglucanase [Krasilnikovia cinnamomea]|uniref:Glucanase n=1 Tax=Krasilnikovia cinnamomea TaxID=349313 RepID=A0A4Q7ZSQ1_9ACTN|nr:glycoside hydrolase family 6 protein [Krasilnikovia cinnamomea]RZU54227.1 endoglucanase [Krasilnikovia cinnamomea]
MAPSLTRRGRRVRALAAVAALAAVVPLTVTPAHAATPPAAARANVPDRTRFYVPAPNPGAVEQIHQLVADGRWGLAHKLRTMVTTPQAVWVTRYSGAELTRLVRDHVRKAARTRSVPVFVAYHIPFRDCGAYSSGGARTVAEYQAWIDAFAAGLGNSRAQVMLEPDSLGIIPWYTDINGNPEWCKPAEADPATAQRDRFTMLNYAVDRFTALPRTSVYLDGTNSNWLSTGDAADRLVRAGVLRADGFFLNVSNFEATPRLRKYGTWIAKCIHYGTQAPTLGRYRDCASQYHPADPKDFSTWTRSDQWYDANVGDVPADQLTHFVVDTSRNGQGSWTPPAGNTWPDPMTWCNPPDRGLGARPTTRTGDPLIDAYLWIKVPGESDGQCDRGTGTGTDPARGDQADPAAGAWFPQQAIELVRLADPPLR